MNYFKISRDKSLSSYVTEQSLLCITQMPRNVFCLQRSEIIERLVDVLILMNEFQPNVQLNILHFRLFARKHFFLGGR